MTFRPYAALSSIATSENRTNNTGSVINKGVPVRINSSGELDFIDVSVESDALSIIAVANQAIPSGTAGAIISTGLIADIATSAGYGDTLWVSKTGGLTDVKPSEGVGGFVQGDLVIFVGVIAKNEINPLFKDLLLSIRVVGQL